MRDNTAVFIAFEERDNLGVAFLASVLREAGYNAIILDFRKPAEAIIKTVSHLKPIILGFSVIFQYHLADFANLIRSLRQKGIYCHFTAGGHFASLRTTELFEILPELDSIVRFEGEYTLLKLVQAIHTGKNWKAIRGISYVENGQLINNDPRPLEPDLDNFPMPARLKPKDYALGKTYTTILAGRGCIHDCIFCDIREFYGPPPGPYKRIRRPEKVIEEIKYLYNDENCSVFLFQDDDFPARSDDDNHWIKIFCDGLMKNNLRGKIMWKINCRPDEIDDGIFTMMKDHGLYQVFLGIEDGTDEGLRKMNKKIRTSEIMRGVNILKEKDIGIDYGFMLFQPDSTFDTVRANLAFLDTLCADGHLSVTFLKMMPHFATRVEAMLEKQGRLRRERGYSDYDFLDKKMDLYFHYVKNVFSEWLYHPSGLLNTCMWTRNYIRVFRFYNGPGSRIHDLSTRLQQLRTESNRFIIDTMFELTGHFESGNADPACEKDKYRLAIREKHEYFRNDAADITRKVCLLNSLKNIIRL